MLSNEEGEKVEKEKKRNNNNKERGEGRRETDRQTDGTEVLQLRPIQYQIISVGSRKSIYAPHCLSLRRFPNIAFEASF